MPSCPWGRITPVRPRPNRVPVICRRYQASNRRESITDIAGEGVRQIQVEGEKPRQADFEHRTSIRQVATFLVSVKLNCMDRFWIVE